MSLPQRQSIDMTVHGVDSRPLILQLAPNECDLHDDWYRSHWFSSLCWISSRTADQFGDLLSWLSNRIFILISLGKGVDLGGTPMRNYIRRSNSRIAKCPPMRHRSQGENVLCEEGPIRWLRNCNTICFVVPMNTFRQFVRHVIPEDCWRRFRAFMSNRK
jgi:hypothetical protein